MILPNIFYVVDNKIMPLPFPHLVRPHFLGCLTMNPFYRLVFFGDFFLWMSLGQLLISWLVMLSNLGTFSFFRSFITDITSFSVVGCKLIGGVLIHSISILGGYSGCNLFKTSLKCFIHRASLHFYLSGVCNCCLYILHLYWFIFAKYFGYVVHCFHIPLPIIISTSIATNHCFLSLIMLFCYIYVYRAISLRQFIFDLLWSCSIFLSCFNVSLHRRVSSRLHLSILVSILFLELFHCRCSKINSTASLYLVTCCQWGRWSCFSVPIFT